MKFFWFCTFICIAGTKTSSAQPFSAFINNRYGFSVFDDFVVKQIDFQKPLDFKIGGNCIAYRDATKNFKVYQDGKLKKVNPGLTTDYQVTSDFVFMLYNTSLHVYDGNRDLLLIRNPTNYFVSDSMIGFEDPIARKYFLYTKGNVITLNDNIVRNPMEVIATGDNIVCYKTSDDTFRIYYEDHRYTLSTIYADSVRASKNIVAYTDHYSQNLHIFFKGESLLPEKFPVLNYVTGNDLVAYETRTREFKIFYAGETYTLGNFMPQNLQVKDDVVAYSDDLGFYYAFYQGKTTLLEKYVPDHVEMSRHSLYYTDANNFIRMFSFGELNELPIQNYLAARLDYDVLRLQTGPYDYKFFYKGKIY